ncbi:protein HGH1 homolog [Glandiceps talaboti]
MADKGKLEEFLQFLTLDTRLDVLSVALQHILGLTGSVEGIRLLQSDMRYHSALFTLFRHPQEAIAKDAYLAVLNLSADEKMARTFVFEYDAVVSNFVEYILKSDSVFADQVCAILTNITRNVECCKKVLKEIEEGDFGLVQIVEVFCNENYNPKNKLHYIGPFLSNLTQLPEARKFILDKDRCVIQRLLPYTQYEASATRKGGIVATLRNCCFETEYHTWLLSDQVDILPRLLLPLAGPEELTEEEMEGMPEDLQYLEEEKKRETDPDIRQMLLEAVFQLCSTKEGRKTVKDKQTYIIIRELHRSEKEPAVEEMCFKLINLLISDEPEPGMEELHLVDIPENVEKKLKETEEKMKEAESNTA